MELYVAQGYEQTTVAEIADRAGVTARTFFRHFADKREVLFAGSHAVAERMVDAVASAPDGATPFDAVAASLDAAAALVGDDIAHAGRRHRIIHANPELLERELIKMSRLADAVTAALSARGVAEAEARLAAEAGITVFRVGYERWVTGLPSGDLATSLRDALGQLRGLVG